MLQATFPMALFIKMGLGVSHGRNIALKQAKNSKNARFCLFLTIF